MDTMSKLASRYLAIRTPLESSLIVRDLFTTSPVWWCARQKMVQLLKDSSLELERKLGLMLTTLLKCMVLMYLSSGSSSCP